jgi:hypothetical protein
MFGYVSSRKCIDELISVAIQKLHDHYIAKVYTAIPISLFLKHELAEELILYLILRIL